ncbi:MAG: hypothetical protein ACKVQW_01910 [Pyrinomonadaceae bacterium]
MPRKILWAWERPEDLRFIDRNEYGVAFLAQTILLENDRVIHKPRRQPLELAPGTYVIAVTRIETNKDGRMGPALDDEMIAKTVSLIKSTLELPDVRGIQVDFDAVVSERAFYRRLMFELRSLLDKSADEGVRVPEDADEGVRVPSRVPLTMTALASWCTGDAWFNDFPVDEAVPMVFQMGADSDKIKTYLRGQNDWQEPLCGGSYGISLEKGKFEGMKPGRRIYYFKNTAWKPSDVDALK